MKTARLARLLRYYREVLGFRLVQHIPGVVALLELDGVALQLWQRNDWGGHSFCVVSLQGSGADIFRLHAALARGGPAALLDSTPVLQPWDSWEFNLLDNEGNQLVFEQWVARNMASQAG